MTLLYDFVDDKTKQYLDDVNYNKKRSNEESFTWACANGHIEIVKLLLNPELEVNIHTNNEGSFLSACAHGHTEIVKLLLNPELNVNIHNDNEGGFRIACAYGHTETVKLLLNPELEVNIHVKNEWGFRWACAYGYVEIVKLLLNPELEVDAHMEYKGKKALEYLKPETINESDSLDLWLVYELVVGQTVPNLVKYKTEMVSILETYIIKDLAKMVANY